jgi:hypothetical protein
MIVKNEEIHIYSIKYLWIKKILIQLPSYIKLNYYTHMNFKHKRKLCLIKLALSKTKTTKIIRSKSIKCSVLN